MLFRVCACHSIKRNVFKCIHIARPLVSGGKLARAPFVWSGQGRVPLEGSDAELACDRFDQMASIADAYTLSRPNDYFVG